MIRTSFFKKNASLRSGDWVEVRSANEILATLDDLGCLDALPFMPEMLKYCGERFRIFKSAHKTCDTIKTYHNRRMENAVHLEGLRCDGEAHDGCQAGCMLFWKEAWLKPIRGWETKKGCGGRGGTRSEMNGTAGKTVSVCNLDALTRATRREASESESAEERYRCQATEMLQATTPLRWWDPRQYMKDLILGNVRTLDFLRYVMIAVFNAIMRLHWRGCPYPYIRGLAGGKTPTEVLNLQVGERVQVRPKDEIMRTLNEHNQNRGLSFDVEMARYCGRVFRVLRRVERIINDRTGKMIRMPNVCLILDGVTCTGCFSRNRLFCPRSIYPYWHEIWLNRVKQHENEGPGNSPWAGEVQRR